ncbi:hypothetical protein H0H81_006937 [Sphagnurus paluster]|uniref:Uncharacterized protein n=1 Tax=Sphagnurus paluster TaxID=117069 RepID=A0A9P7GRM7_9AGAR|nr:hypothetical protein H0H81_006937 [Sphagnurus paluster]
MSYAYASQQWSQTDSLLTYNLSQCAQPSQYPTLPYPGVSTVAANILRPNASVVLHQPYVHPSTLPISSYSTLSGALDFGKVTSDATKSGRSSCSIRKDGRKPSQYDVPRPSRSRSNSQVSSSPGSCSSSSRSMRGVRAQCTEPADTNLRYQHDVHTNGPTNHVLVPQIPYAYADDERRKWCPDPAFRQASIIFQSENIPEPGVRVGKISHSAYPPPIQGADDPVFAASGDREIKLWIVWPGYSTEPLQKRIKTQGGKLTRQLLLTLIANMVLDFTYEIHRKKIPIEAGYLEWAIGDKNGGFVGGELFITRLVHRGGSNWQPEIWAPRRR